MKNGVTESKQEAREIIDTLLDEAYRQRKVAQMVCLRNGIEEPPSDDFILLRACWTIMELRKENEELRKRLSEMAC